MNDGITLYSLMRIHVNDFQTSHLTTVNVCAYINKFVFENFLLRIKIVVKTFSIPDKLFLKLVYYFVPLGHILVKSIINLVIFVFVCPAIVLFIYLFIKVKYYK